MAVHYDTDAGILMWYELPMDLGNVGHQYTAIERAEYMRDIAALNALKIGKMPVDKGTNT